MQYRFDWSVLWSGATAEWLRSGLFITMELTLVGWLLAGFFGTAAGALRTAPSRLLRAPALFYVEFFKNVPLLVWMFFWYFGVPPLLPRAVQEWLFDYGVEFAAAAFALGVYHGARFSEIVRAGIQSIPKTQFEAALSTGLTALQAYRFVVLPTAIRLIVPPMTNESLNLLKNSSIALTIGVAELTFQTRQIETYTGKAIEALIAATVIYLALCVGIALFMRQVERRFAIPGMIIRLGRRSYE